MAPPHKINPTTISLLKLSQLNRAWAGIGVSSSISAGPKLCLAEPCPPTANFCGAKFSADSTEQSRRQNNQGKWRIEYEYSEKRQGCHRPKQPVFQRPRNDAVSCEWDNGGYRRYNAVKHAGNGGQQMPEGHIKPAAANQDKQRRKDKQPACDHPASSAVHEPAYVDCQLLCFGTRQQHTVVECMQITLFRNPAFLLV